MELFNISKAIFYAAILVGIVTYAAAVTRMLRRLSERREKERDRFFKALTEGFKVGAVKTLLDIENLYKGVCRISTEEGTKPARLSKWLREYLVELLEAGTKAKENSDEKLIWKDSITAFIEQLEQQSPYANLPDLERSIITDIEVFLNSDDKTAIERKLGEITAAIQVREESFAKIRSTNRWSVPLAVIGLVLTITFGLISLFK